MEDTYHIIILHNIIYIYTYVYACMHAYVCMCVCVYVCMCVCVYVCMCVCVYVCMCIYILYYIIYIYMICKYVC